MSTLWFLIVFDLNFDSRIFLVGFVAGGYRASGAHILMQMEKTFRPVFSPGEKVPVSKYSAVVYHNNEHSVTLLQKTVSTLLDS